MTRDTTIGIETFLETLTARIGRGALITDPNDMSGYLIEHRDLYKGRAAAIVRPASVEDVAETVRLAAEHHVAIVPQGGNTGLVGGQIPDTSGREIVLSLTRLNRVRAADADDATLTVEAGVTLKRCQDEAEKLGLFFPLSLASEGTATIGGNLATNAGGTAVLKYGNARALCLGLEAVMADGRVWHGLRALHKDNTGYDLRDLLIGSEGTLGIITAAVLKLFPRPRDVETAMVAVGSPADAIKFLRLAQGRSGDLVTTFELMPHIGIEFVTRHVAGTTDPFSQTHPWMVLLELSTGQAPGTLRATLEDILAGAYEDGLITDAVIAESGAQRAALWTLRESMSEVQRLEGGSIKHDISVPVGRMATFIERADKAVHAAYPGVRPVAFGHVGDGNVHYNLSQPIGADRTAFLARWQEMNDIVHDIAADLGGSISAEHGLGQLKIDEVRRYKSAVELDAMAAIKRAFDPLNILNPGKVVRLGT